LRKSGFETVEAESGAAIDFLCARGSEIDLNLLDRTIPGRSTEKLLPKPRWRDRIA
jgi:hypothetical protein